MDLISKLVDVLEVERKNGKFAEIDESLIIKARETVKQLESRWLELSDIEQDQLRTLKRLLWQIYQRRASKLVKLAMLTSFDYDEVELPHHILEQESQFFRQIKTILAELKAFYLGGNGYE